MQRKVLTNFHYALNKKGYLVLGKSETIASAAELFSGMYKKLKIFEKNAEAIATAMPDYSLRTIQNEERIDTKIWNKPKVVKDYNQQESLDNVIDNILLTQYIPPGVVVNYDLDIIQFKGATGLFLEPSPGKASLNLLKMVRPGLELELRNATHKVIKSGESIKIEGLNVTVKDNIHHVSVEVTPLLEQTKEKLLLIVFEEVKTPSSADLKISFSKDTRVKQLENELIALREDMRSLIEDQEVANEELQSANEEIVSSNEELQSINEELSTSKEELEASNEDLLTINQELQIRNDQLGESHEYSTKVIETIREAVIILDDHLLVKSANESFYRTFKLKAEDVEGKLIYEISNGHWNINGLKKLLEEIVIKHGQYYGYEVTQWFQDMGEKVLMLNVRRIVQKSNGQKIILLAIEDITEHRQAKRLLEEREAWLRNMADNVPVMIWVAAPNQSFTFVNKTLLAFTGRAMEAEIGIGWMDGIHKDDIETVLKEYKGGFKERRPFSIECRMKRHDGEYRWVVKSAVPTYDSRGTFSGYTGTCVEVHNKKVLYEELEKQIKEKTHDLLEANISLERSNADLAQFAYVASHDLQEPLRKIATFSTRLKERFTKLIPDQGNEYIDKINSSAERMRRLIDDLLNFSRIARFQDKFVETDLNKVLKDVLGDFDLLIQEKKATVFLQDTLPVMQSIPPADEPAFFEPG